MEQHQLHDDATMSKTPYFCTDWEKKNLGNFFSFQQQLSWLCDKFQEKLLHK